MNTRVTELLNIQHPIIQGGMAWVSEGHLAASVSEAGGLGIIAGGGAPYEAIKAEIHKARAITKKPVGVNIMLLSPFADDLARLVVEENIEVVTTGAGSPWKYLESFKAANIKVLPVVASVALARKMERMGVDAVIAEGCEAGGHIGELTTMALIPQVVDAVSIPVLAAGGIADGRGMAAALSLGAEGVQCGTCLLAAKECVIHQVYKDTVIKAGDISTIVTGRSTGHPVRSLKTPLTRDYQSLEDSGASFEELEKLTLGSLRKAVKDGDYKEGTFMAGQIAGLIKEEQSVSDIMNNMVYNAESILKNISKFF